MSLEHSLARQKLLASAAAKGAIDPADPAAVRWIVFDDVFYTLKECSAIRGCSVATLWREIARGDLTALKDGRSIRIRGRALRARMDSLPKFESRAAEALGSKAKPRSEQGAAV
jgi:hypothetical protein